MRLPLRHAWTLACLTVVVTEAAALERTPVLFPDELERGSWSRGGIATVSYYNICTGWTWALSSLEPESRVGVWFQTNRGSDAGAFLNTTYQLLSGAPSGYGFTGTLAVHPADASGCPVGPPLASQTWLPPEGPSWMPVSWGTLPLPSGSPGWILVATTGPGERNPMVLFSDLPSSGPTGPPACGTCYPTNRAGHSRRYGTVASPLCPGAPFQNWGCAVELLWIAEGAIVKCTSCSVATGIGASLESSSWARIKALYGN